MGARRYRITYEDEWIIVVDKPSGMLVIPTPKKETNTLTDELNRELDERGIETNAYPCHRLDRETSGLIIYAKGKKTQALMMDQFRKKAVKKTYIAFVHGMVTRNSGSIKDPLYYRTKNKWKAATTNYKVMERRNDFSVLEVEPVTGRTNQIRLHFKGIGHPLVGESMFIFRKDFKLKFKRLALHAENIEFTHPMTKQKMEFSSPLPEDMKNFLKKGSSG